MPAAGWLAIFQFFFSSSEMPCFIKGNLIIKCPLLPGGAQSWFFRGAFFVQAEGRVLVRTVLLREVTTRCMQRAKWLKNSEEWLGAVIVGQKPDQNNDQKVAYVAFPW